MNRAGVWSRVIRVFALLTPDTPESWVDAIRAELYAIPTGGEQRRYAMSSLRGLVTIGVTLCLRRWAGHLRALVLAAAVGFAIAAIDLTSQTRLPLLVGLILGCATMGITAPGVSRISGLILGLGSPALAALVGYRDQYAAALSTVWMPLLPSVVLSSMFGWLRKRYEPRR